MNMATNETVNQEVEQATEQAEKTFTQSELDQIIGERLKREREKYPDYDALKEKAAKLDQIEEDAKSELQKATERADKLQAELSAIKHREEVRTVREAVSTKYGIPVNLLSGETEEACAEQAKALIDFKASAPYPTVKDGGEIQNAIKGSTRQQFAEWAKNALNS